MTKTLKTWPENQQPTDEQFVDYFLSLERSEQLFVASAMMHNARLATQCFEEDHRGQLERSRTVLEDNNDSGDSSNDSTT
jgi:hypothetical protein